jgi:hypothetical protein
MFRDVLESRLGIGLLKWPYGLRGAVLVFVPIRVCI